MNKKPHSRKTRVQIKTQAKEQSRLMDKLRQRRRALTEGTFIITMIALIGLFYVGTRVAVVKKGYRLNDLAQSYRQLEEQHRTLRLELATRKSPRQLIPQATKDLHLAPPSPDQVVVIPSPLQVAEQAY